MSQLDQWLKPGFAASEARMLTAAEAVQRVPLLNAASIAAAVLLSEVKDIDAAAVLQGYLKMLHCDLTPELRSGVLEDYFTAGDRCQILWGLR